MLLLSREKTMLNEKQIAANRANAQLSTGPKTEEGKRKSSLNARRHNLTGQVTAMTPEDRLAHDAFSAGIVKSMAPEGELELTIAHRIATDFWRLNRASAIEDNIFALGLSAHADDSIDQPEIQAAFAAARTFIAEGKSIELLTLYEQRLNRSLQKNLAVLQSLQATRKAAVREGAAKRSQLNEIKGLHHAAATGAKSGKEPDNASGFVFSNGQMHAAADAITGPPILPPTGASGLHAINFPR
jgi:hypothetical protein